MGGASSARSAQHAQLAQQPRWLTQYAADVAPPHAPQGRALRLGQGLFLAAAVAVVLAVGRQQRQQH